MLVVEFRNHHIVFVEGTTSKRKITIKKTHEVEYNPEWIAPSGVLQVQELSNLIHDTLESQHFSVKGDVTFCFNLSNSIFRELKVPAVDGKKLNVMVRSEMINTLNLSQNYLIDYVILGDEITDEGHFYNVLAIAVSDEYFESFMEVAKYTGLKVKVADFSVNTMIKMTEASSHLVSNCITIVLTVSKEHLRMYLFDGHQYVFTRSVLINSNQFEKDILDNLTRMIQFMYSRLENNTDKQIVLTGSDAMFEMISTSIEQSLGIRCVSYVIPDLIQNASDKSLQPYISSIGAFIRRDK